MILVYSLVMTEVYRCIGKGSWNRDLFDSSGYHIETRKYNEAQLLIDEHKYQIDINKDDVISGEKNCRVYSNAYKPQSMSTNVAGLYKADSGAIFDSNTLIAGDNLNNPTNALTKNGSIEFEYYRVLQCKPQLQILGVHKNYFSAFLKESIGMN